MCDKLPVMIYIESSDPDALKGVNQGKIIMNNTGGNIIYSKQKEQNEDKKI